MDGREKSHSREASASKDFARMEITEDEDWVTVKTVYTNGPPAHSSTLEKDATTSYSTNREKIYHKKAGTIEETHVLESSGRATKDFAEEHWSSEIKSYVTLQPPKFIQVIKAFRVLATDTLTLVVEVKSDPPAIFEWFCNDKPVQQDRRKFKARHGINITTLTVEGPEQGVYKCTARNPAGVSTTYGYITVNAPPPYRTWLEHKHEVIEEMKAEIVEKEKKKESVDVPPKFIHQIPNLTLRPGIEAVIDVEVEASPPAKFTWYVNGIEFRDSSGQIEVYYPATNRCVGRFPIPQTGEYKAVAENRAGKDESIGYIDIKKEIVHHQTQLPPLPSDHLYHRSTYTESERRQMPPLAGRGRASSVTRTIDVYEESSYYQRSTSLPRQSDHPYEIRKTTEIIRKSKDDWDQLEQQQQQQYSSFKRLMEEEKEQLQVKKRRRSETTRTLPHAPVFTGKLPAEVSVASGEDLVLSVDVKATPQADVKWNVNGFELKDSKNVTVINEKEHSTLTVRPPIRYGRYSVTATNQYGMVTQATQVHRDEEEQFEQVEEEVIICQRLSLPPEFVDSAVAISTSALADGWEIIDEQQRSSKSADSFETVKHVETIQAVAEGAEAVATTREPLQASTYTERRYEETSGAKSEVIYEAPLKPGTPIIHEPLRAETVTAIEPVRGSLYTEKENEEILSTKSKAVRETTVAPPVPSKPVGPTTHDAKMLTERNVEEAGDVQSEATKTIVSNVNEIIERKTFGIPVHRTTEPLPKRPFVLKQPKPEIRLKSGEKLVLESTVDSFPESQFKWYQNNFEVKPSPHVFIESPCVNVSRAIFMKPISGTYKVVASNMHGSCTSTTRVVTEISEDWVEESNISVVRSLPERKEPKYQLVKKSRIETRTDLPKAPRIVESFAPIVRVPKDELLILSAVADAIPEAKFQWLLNNFEVRPSQTVAIERLGPNTSQATFRAPVSGRYEVIAVNPLGQDSRSGKVIVEVAEQLPVAPVQRISRSVVPRVPVFVKALPGETPLRSEEQEFRLSVLVRGEQPLTFRWFADGSLLSNSVEHQMVNELERSTLVVRKRVEYDVDYAVEVSNVNGAVWSETTVKPASLVGSLIASTISPEIASPESVPPEMFDSQRRSPRFTTTLTSLVLQQNDEFTARVTIDLDSSPCEFVWTLNGRDIRTVPGFRVESTFYESTLYVKSAMPKHSGELAVTASNKYGSAKSSSKITVQRLRRESYEFIPESRTMPAEKAPAIISPLQASVFRAGEPLKLVCRVDGSPAPEVVWTKDEIRIDEWMMEKEVTIVHYPDGTCEMTKTECVPEDAGLYRLTARNIHGTAETAAYVHVEGKETRVEETRGEVHVIHRLLSEPRFSEISSKQYEHETIVSCHVVSDTPVQVSWYKKGQRLYQTYKHRMESLLDNIHTLTICNVDKWDEGLYTCRAENQYGSTETSIYIQAPVHTREETEEMLVEECTDEVIGFSDKVKYIKKEYTDTTIKVTATPEVSGSQEMYSHTAELRKNEEEYKLLVKVAEIVASKLVARVVIEEAIHAAVKLMREEMHSSEEEEIESTLEHFNPPRFETNIECYTVNVGDAVVLRTDIGGYPQPHIEWYFGEQRLEQTEQIELQYVSGRATVTIKKVEKLHEGTYYCHAENKYGKAVLSCNLRVIDVAQGRTESTYEIVRAPLTYTLSQTEAEVSSNVHVSHAAESYEHHFSVLQPETIALGYSCIASTSQVHDDSVIITREWVQKAIQRELEAQTPSEACVVLNVNVERAPAHLEHDTLIIQSTTERAIILGQEPRCTRTQEVMQTSDIRLVEERHLVQLRQSTVNAMTTVVLEKPGQRAIHEVTCLYDEKAHVTKEKIQGVSTIDLKKVELVNELISTVMATKEEHRAHAVANVDVRRPDATFDHVITIVEWEREHLEEHLVVSLPVQRVAVIDSRFQLPEQSLRAESVRVEWARRCATAAQRIVILEGLQQKFTEAITWSLKKIRKEAAESGVAAAHANVEVRRPEQIGEHTTTIVDTTKIVPELLAIAAAASKLKITSVFVTFTRKGDVAHQALVIEYESFVEDEATLNVAMLTAPGFHSKQEDVWSRERKYERIEESETNVVAVFVEVDATCPDQTVELVASVSLPPSAPGHISATRSAQSIFEASSASWSESSSAGLLQAPRFIKTLDDIVATVGHSYQFKCIVSGTPAPVIRWYVDGDVIQDSDVYQTVYEDGVCILKIRELAIEDEGEYTCEAINDAGRAMTKCFLRTITVSDSLDYRQAMFEDTLYGNYMESWDSFGSLSSGSGLINWNPGASRGTIRDDNSLSKEPVIVVNYEFVRTDPTLAETTAIVTRYTTPQKGFRNHFASEERNFNISVSLADAIMQCDFVWLCHNWEHVGQFLMLPAMQVIDFVIQISRPKQAEEASLLLSSKKRTYEATSFADCQPWEEILLLKRPENAFVSDSEFRCMQKVWWQVDGSFDETDNATSKNNTVDGFLVKNDCFGRSSHCCIDVAIERVVPLAKTGLAILQADSRMKLKRSLVAAEATKLIGGTEQRDERKEPRTVVLPSKFTYKGQEMDVDIVLKDDKSEENEIYDELLQKTAEKCPEINSSSLAAIRRYVDALLDFGPTLAAIIPTKTESDQADIIRSISASGSTKAAANAVSFVEEYLSCSFHRESEHDEAIESRGLSVSKSENSASKNYGTRNTAGLKITCVKSDPNIAEQVKLYKNTLTPASRTPACKSGCDRNEVPNQKVGNPGSHGKQQEDVNENCLSRLLTQEHLNDEPVPEVFDGSADIIHAGTFFDLREDFEASKPYPQSESTQKSEISKAVGGNSASTNSFLNSGYQISSEERSVPQFNTKGEILLKVRAIEEVAKEVEAGLEADPQCNEALQIECAIYDISKQLEHQQPLTEAQAEASEELLKTMLENIIVSSGPIRRKEAAAAYRRPIALLRQKLTDLERMLTRDFEFKELPVSLSLLESTKPVEYDHHRRGSAEKEISTNSAPGVKLSEPLERLSDKQEVKRMTPLTSNIKEQLEKLETLLVKDENDGEEEDAEEIASEAEAVAPIDTYAKHHEVHNILMQINSEISIIKRYCQRNISKKSVDTAVSVLHKVRNNVSSMIDLVSMSKKRFRKKMASEKDPNTGSGRMKSPKRAEQPLSPLSRTGFFFKTDASVNFYFMKPEEVEVINAIVMLRSASDKSGNQMLRSENSEISLCEDAMTAVFDDNNKPLPQVTQDDLISQKPFSRAAAEGERRLPSSVIVDLSKDSPSVEEFQTPLPPPRKRRVLDQQEGDSVNPVPPPRPKHNRTKSCGAPFAPHLSSVDCPLPSPQSIEKDFRREVEPSQPNTPTHTESDSGNCTHFKVASAADLVVNQRTSLPKQNTKLVEEVNAILERAFQKEECSLCCSHKWPSCVKCRISLETFDECSSVQLICEDSDYAPELDAKSLLLFDVAHSVSEDSEDLLLQRLALLPSLSSAVGEVMGPITKMSENVADQTSLSAGIDPGIDGSVPRESEESYREENSKTPELFEGYKDHILKPSVEMSEKQNASPGTLENTRGSTYEHCDFDRPAATIPESQDTKPRLTSLVNPSEDDTSSLHEIESIDDKDEFIDELNDVVVICNPHASVIDNIDVLPTIMEGSESSKNTTSLMSVSTNTVIVTGGLNISYHSKTGSNIFGRAEIENGDTPTPTLELTMVAAESDDEDEANYLDEYKKRVIVVYESETEQDPEEMTITVAYKRCSNKLKVLAVLSPEVRAKAAASTVAGEDFDVFVEQPDEVQNFTVKISEQMNDSISLDLVLPNTIDVDLSLTQDEQYAGVVSYQAGKLSSSGTDEDLLNQRHPSSTDEDSERYTGVSVSIAARSLHDVARASLEEIPWGEVSIHIVMQSDMVQSVSDSEAKNSLIQNVTVSESNETEKRSLRSHESFRSSSQRSFDLSEFGDRYDSWQNVNVPCYVIREGSTATITCEFNNFLYPGSIIDWFRGKAVIEIEPGKTDRISHDLLEVLVISHIELSDGDVYSIRVNDVVYPIACLIVEDADASSDKIDEDIRFLSPPQTLFVMEGQPAIISCQVNATDQKVEWCKDNKKWVAENERVRFEADQFGYHRIIIDKSELEDQGTYYAFLGDHFTTVTLVVEERIEEREVTINASGTESEEDDYREYLVPPGSTATIACELENSDEVRELVWRKDGARIEFTDDAKVEHVMNGLKHYLVIHDTQEEDSACYSVCINDIEFKIAHLIVCLCATPIAGCKHTKRISSTSLHHVNH